MYTPSEVYDVSSYLDDHPGGDDVLLQATGKDATEEFEDAGHSKTAREQMETFCVGELDPSDIPQLEAVAEKQKNYVPEKLVQLSKQYWAVPVAAVEHTTYSGNWASIRSKRVCHGKGKGVGDNLGTGVKNDSVGNKLKQNDVFDLVVSCYSSSFDFLPEEPSRRKVKFHTLKTEQTDLAHVLIPMSSVLEVHARKTALSYKLSKEELTSVRVWIKFHDVLASAFTADRLSVIATSLGTPVMLDSCTETTCVQSWGRVDYTRALVDIRADRALKDTMVEYEWKPSRYGTCLVFGHDDAQCPKRVIVDMRNLRKQGGTSNDGFQIVQMKGKKMDSTPMSNSFSALEEDIGTHMDDLVDGKYKKVGDPPMKIGIWSGRKGEFSSQSGFTSPNPFDLLTNDDGKSMLRDL
ncbi:cytochrome b5 [Tanacetum coccineum]